MLGQVGHAFNDINKFYRNFFWLKFKVTLQDIQYFCSKQTRIRQLTNATVSEIPLRRGQLHCDHQKLNLINKTFQDNNTLHLFLFLKENYGFHYSTLFLVALNLFVIIILLKVHNHAVPRYHIFSLFSHNRHDHARIGILVNIFSIRSSSLQKIFCCLSHP